MSKYYAVYVKETKELALVASDTSSPLEIYSNGVILGLTGFFKDELFSQRINDEKYFSLLKEKTC